MTRRVWVVEYRKPRARRWHPWQMNTSRRDAQRCVASMVASREFGRLAWRVVEYVPAGEESGDG